MKIQKESPPSQSIPRSVVSNHIKNLDEELTKISTNPSAEKILMACDDMLVAKKKIVSIYEAFNRQYVTMSKTLDKGHNLLKLYMKLWEKSKRKHIPLTALYKPSDF